MADPAIRAVGQMPLQLAGDTVRETAVGEILDAKLYVTAIHILPTHK